MKMKVFKHMPKSVLFHVFSLVSLGLAAMFTVISISMIAVKAEYEVLILPVSGIALYLALALITKLISNHYNKVEFMQMIKEFEEETQKDN